MKRSFDRFFAQVPSLACHRLPDFAWARPRSTGGRPALAQVRVAALYHRLHLAFGQDSVAKRDGEPHRLDDVQQFRELDAERGEVVARRGRPSGRQDGAGQHDGRDFLGAGVHCMTLQHGRLAQLPFHVPKVQLVFPALPIRLC